MKTRAGSILNRNGHRYCLKKPLPRFIKRVWPGFYSIALTDGVFQEFFQYWGLVSSEI